MIVAALQAITLTAIYLLMLTSVNPGDLLVGVILSVAIVTVGRRVRLPRKYDVPPLKARFQAAPKVIARTLADIVRGTWRVARYVVTSPPRGEPGIIAVPIGERSGVGVAAWAFTATLSPDEIVVDIDEQQGVLLLHVLDASDPDGVRAQHQDAYERRQRDVFP